MTYSEFQPTFEEKVKRETYLENILLNAKDLIMKDTSADAIILNDLRIKGTASNNNTCDYCKRSLKLDKQSVEMFKCGHNFHRMCIKEQAKGNCSLCFNEYEHIQQII
jgi:hypothetical protein